MNPRWKELKDDPKLREMLVRRAKLLAAVRGFFDARGYVEMETPLMVATPGTEPHLDPFETVRHTPTGESRRGFLITSPEYALKKLLAAGFSRIYQLGKCFRDGEGSGGRHNPEFTMLEWYRTETDYIGIMDETEQLFRHVAEELGVRALQPKLFEPWERLTVEEAMRRYAQVDLLAAMDDKKILLDAAAALGHPLPPETAWDDAFFAVFLNAVEPKLGFDRPTFLHRYPISMAALSKPAKDDPRFAERFELYVNGLELANAFSELTDPNIQRARFQEERALRKSLGKTDVGLDEELLEALASMPPAGGISVGIDRMAMLFLGASDIRQVIAFPADSMYSSNA